jgi:dienelactone hydrolase
MARPNVAERNDYRRAPYEAGGITHDVYRGGDSGPVVLLLHEMPSFSWRTVNLANAIRRRGYRIVMPILIGGVREKPVGPAGKAAALVVDGVELVVNLGRICVSWQFVALMQRRTSPITSWLLSLAREEAARSEHRQVGVIGMCFSGGFALATAIDPIVGVAVVSQPALPFANGPLKGNGRDRDLGLSEPDRLRLLDRKGDADFCVAALRYEQDTKSPGPRVQRIKDELGDSATLTWIPGPGHPVLTDATDEKPHATVRKQLDDALDHVIGTLDARLKV